MKQPNGPVSTYVNEFSMARVKVIRASGNLLAASYAIPDRTKVDRLEDELCEALGEYVTVVSRDAIREYTGQIMRGLGWLENEVDPTDRAKYRAATADMLDRLERGEFKS